MTSSAPANLIPTHRHRAMALRAELSWFKGDYDILPMLAAECETPADVDLFICALLDSWGRVMAKRLKDPEGYLAGWLALEQAEADLEAATGTPEDGPEQLD